MAEYQLRFTVDGEQRNRTCSSEIEVMAANATLRRMGCEVRIMEVKQIALDEVASRAAVGGKAAKIYVDT